MVWLWLIPGSAALVVVALWISNWWLLRNHAERGTFGDMFGVVNALFSGLAFIGVITAILLQRRELRLQRLDLELTRNEIKGQKIQLERQNETMKRQVLENTFFQLLRAHNDIISSIDLVGSGGRTTTGRDCFRIFYKRLRSKITSNAIANYKNRLNTAYADFFVEQQGDLAHYFASLEALLDFADKADSSEPGFYTSLVRSQLSSQEILVLFYHARFGPNAARLAELVKRHSVLARVPFQSLIDQGKDVGLYEPQALGL